MQPAMRAIHEQFTLNTDLFRNVVRDLDDGKAGKRPTGDNNHALFLALHLVDTRHFLAQFLGEPLENPFASLVEGKKTIDDFDTFPPLADITAAWDRISSHLAGIYEKITLEQLDAELPIPFPVKEPKMLSGIAFMTHHDAYHIGQLGYLRKGLGLGPMAYDRT
ncbi:MAG: DinB family protein [Gemmatimonadetes bacterium]|nr:DinB family protein [Gemmatimonadota bacterium]